MGDVVGTIDPRYSRIFEVLRSEGDIDYEGYVKVTPLSKNANSRNRPKQECNQTSKSNVMSCTLSAIFYGPMDKFEDVGEFFFQCSEYLQSPLHCSRNVPYRNPQSLSGGDEDPPMTFDLRKELTSFEFETLTRGADPSAALQSGTSFPETEPPAAIRTPLYRQVDTSIAASRLIIQSS